MAYKYSTTITENCAKAVGVGLAISRKQSVQICQAIRGMNVQKAKKYLEEVILLKRPVPYTKNNKNVGHRAGMASGRYPIKASKQILNLLKSAEANAQFKGLSTGNLIIKHSIAQKGPSTRRYGRKNMKAKSSHIELVVEEVKK